MGRIRVEEGEPLGWITMAAVQNDTDDVIAIKGGHMLKRKRENCYRNG